MNLAHVHLILNHIPVIAIPLLALLLFGFLITQNQAAQKLTLLMLVAVSIVAIPVFWTGEPAEEIVESIQGVNKVMLEEHEDAGQFALILTLLTGTCALVSTIMLRSSSQKAKKAVNLTLILCLFTSVGLARTAFLGGHIRHTEIQQNGLDSKGASRE